MKNPLVILLMVLIFLALVANLVVVAVRGESPITEDMVKMIAFFGIVGANVALAGAGFYFVTKAYRKSERSSLGWARWGYVANLVVTAIFALAPWFFYDYVKTTNFTQTDAMFEIFLVLLLFGIPHFIFVLSSHREYRRSAGSRPKHRRRHSASGARDGVESTT